MEPERTPQFQAEDAVPLRGSGRAKGALEEKAASAEEPVPLRPALDRIEAEERAERLRLVTGRRLRAPRWSRSR
ncbi:MAG: hypothetical protein ACTHN3_11370 [Solirubrobacterales bacterium]